MSAKQDRAAPRTVSDIERKYNFGKSFAEVIGLVEDTRDEVDEASSKLEGVDKRTSELERTSEELKVTFKTEGVSITSTGYTFDSEGLKINKYGEEETNLLDNTGMYVKKNGRDILTANDQGVVATDLHAKTYLKIGSGDGRSRFEDYGSLRVGCYWTGW
jgi:hypothetical protein